MQNSQRLSSLYLHSGFKHAIKVIENLNSHGHQALFAGGCVRDALLGKIPKDLDIATSALPDEVEKLFPNTLAVGKAFGVIVVVTEAGPFDVASFRFDGPYLDGRRPSHVKFTNAREDALRRDFTINAMFYDPIKSEILDYVGGLEDLQIKLIKTVGKAEDRFNEDKLRMLRAARFSAQLGFFVEDKTELAIAHRCAEIVSVSKERIFHEMSRMLSSPYWRSGLQLMRRTGLANYIWPELFHAKVELPASGGGSLNWEMIFCEICLHLGSETQAESRLVAWGAPKKSIRKVMEIFVQSALLIDSKSSRAQRIKAIGSTYFSEVLAAARLRLVKSRRSPLILQNWINEYLEVSGPDAKMPAPLVSGAELIKFGFSSDKKLGEVLKLLYDEQLEGRINSKPEALNLAKLHLA